MRFVDTYKPLLSGFIIALFSFFSLFAEEDLLHIYTTYEQCVLNQLPEVEKNELQKEEVSLEELQKRWEKNHKRNFFNHIFLKLKKASQYIKYSPYENRRTGKNIQKLYDNASEVVTPCQRYIVASAPLDNTISDFWKLVLETGVETIVTLVTPYEHGRYNMVEYWSNQHLPYLSSDNWSISCISDSKVVEEVGKKRQEAIYVRELVFEKNVSDKNRKTIVSPFKKKVAQIHYWNWEDNGVPNPKLFQKLLKIVNQIHTSPYKPILVHCAAGIGRSGTFVVTHSLMKELSQRKSQINIPWRILCLRAQRAYLVGTKRQYRAIVEALVHSDAPTES